MLLPGPLPDPMAGAIVSATAWPGRPAGPAGEPGAPDLQSRNSSSARRPARAVCACALRGSGLRLSAATCRLLAFPPGDSSTGNSQPELPLVSRAPLTRPARPGSSEVRAGLEAPAAGGCSAGRASRPHNLGRLGPQRVPGQVSDPEGTGPGRLQGPPAGLRRVCPSFLGEGLLLAAVREAAFWPRGGLRRAPRGLGLLPRMRMGVLRAEASSRPGPQTAQPGAFPAVLRGAEAARPGKPVRRAPHRPPVRVRCLVSGHHPGGSLWISERGTMLLSGGKGRTFLQGLLRAARHRPGDATWFSRLARVWGELRGSSPARGASPSRWNADLQRLLSRP